jgi:2-oxoglutarate/2-oxoacid ferredoxin oxidoreductase subunit alpha
MKSPSESINWKVAGLAGEGIDVTGIMFGKLCMRQGMNVFAYREYPSLIRGGHNTHQVHASFQPQTSQQKHIDLLVALNEESVALHVDELDETSVVFCEAAREQFDIQKYAACGATFYDIPMTNMAREETGHFLAQNVVSLGASVWMLGLDLEILKKVIADQFGSKSETVVAANHRAMQRGYDYAKEHCQPLRQPFPKEEKSQILVTGNHAVALGALSAGLQYFSAYPMTPTSDILHTVAAQQAHLPLVVKHAEDEISAINQVIGASYAGVRSMTASATGGFALMVEAVSLAAVMETPLVICVGQRPGPATGLPTWSCQSDLQFVINAGHGECPKVVFTPGNVREHFELTRLAFYLAEKYHLIVFILSDKLALESYATMPKPDEIYQNDRYSFIPTENLATDNSYRRFEVTEEGYSPRSIPGQPHGLSVTNSYEHDEFGYATESAELTKAMNEKRHRKMKGVSQEVPPALLIGSPNAEITLVGWGSTLLAGEEVVRQAEEKINYIHIPCAWPFPKESFVQLASQAKHLIMVEGNTTGQMEKLIRQETGIEMSGHMRRYDGRPFYAEEILKQLTEMGLK